MVALRGMLQRDTWLLHSTFAPEKERKSYRKQINATAGIGTQLNHASPRNSDKASLATLRATFREMQMATWWGHGCLCGWV